MVSTSTDGVPPQSAHRGARLLDDVVAFLRRFVVLSPEQADAVALWSGHTHAFAAAETTPYLHITSAEKRSGKTRLLEILEVVVARPWLTGRVTPAVLARKIDDQRPTLLLDESDAAFKGDPTYAETLRGVLNSGFRDGGSYSVVVGQGSKMTYKDFGTFSPKAIAGIDGSLPDTVRDRSVRIELKRRAPGEHVERFRRKQIAAEAKPLRAAFEQWASTHLAALAEAVPSLPDELNDRAADVWEPLLAIADAVGEDWSSRARRAALVLSGGIGSDDPSIGVRLLWDIQDAFERACADRLGTKDLIQRLARDDEGPWGDWHGKPLTPRALARLLAPFGVKSKNIRRSEDIAKGYLREQFFDAWARYVLPSATPLQPAPDGLDPVADGEPREGHVAGAERGDPSVESTYVADVADAGHPADRMLRAAFGAGLIGEPEYARALADDGTPR